MAETFAHLLCQFRTRRGLTKGELALNLGADPKTLRLWEQGVRVPRDRARLDDLAQVLHLSPAEAEQLAAAARQHSSPQPNAMPPPDNMPAAQPITPPSAGPSHHQLRTPLPDFVGHTETIRMLTDTLGRASTDGRVAAISGVRGMGGIGKTELAYMVANHLIENFPDAQLVLSLRGASASPLSPIQAIQQVIYAFTPEVKLPDDPEALQRHYRSVLHHKRVLILADDAQEAAQVRPLLPPAGCALLITSRLRFTLPGMTTIDLEVLDEATAVRLLCSLCHRLSTADAQHLARVCGYLPLALRIAGSLLHNNPALAIATFLARLADEQQRLAQLRDPDDGQLDVAATLALSYAQLEEPDQRAFRQLGVFVADFSTELARAVIAAPEDRDVVATLHGLLRRNLVMYDRARERWQLHDLVRDLAWQELEQQDESEAVQWRYAQATIAIAKHAHDQYLAGGERVLVGLSQFDTERAHIDAAYRWAQHHTKTPEGDQLLLDIVRATLLIGFIRYDLRHESIPQWEGVRTAARRLGNQLEEGRALNNLGLAYYYLGEPHTAIRYFEQILAITRELGDRQREGVALGNLGLAYADLGELDTAICYLQQHLTTDRELGDRHGEARSLNNLGRAHAYQGQPHTAIGYFEQALTINRELGDRQSEGITFLNLGLVYTNLGDTEYAIDACNESLTILRTIGDRRLEGYALTNLARAQTIEGEIAQASTTFDQALTLLQETGDRWGAAECQWLFGLALMQQGERERALPLLHAAVAYEQEIGHTRAAEHAALIGRLKAGEELPAELRVPKAQRAIGDNREALTEEDTQP